MFSSSKDGAQYYPKRVLRMAGRRGDGNVTKLYMDPRKRKEPLNCLPRNKFNTSHFQILQHIISNSEKQTTMATQHTGKLKTGEEEVLQVKTKVSLA